jgi:four helix bundle protein
MDQGRLPIELRDQTKQFASGTIRLFVRLPKQREEVRVFGKQLLRAGTSVAAHVRKVCRTRSDAEFCSKLVGAQQEADEWQLRLALLRDDCGIHDETLGALLRESGEMVCICVNLVGNTRNRFLADSSGQREGIRAVFGA